KRNQRQNPAGRQTKQQPGPADQKLNQHEGDDEQANVNVVQTSESSGEALGRSVRVKNYCRSDPSFPSPRDPCDSNRSFIGGGVVDVCHCREIAASCSTPTCRWRQHPGFFYNLPIPSSDCDSDSAPADRIHDPTRRVPAVDSMAVTCFCWE